MSLRQARAHLKKRIEAELAQLSAELGSDWCPFPEYKDDPVGFFREVLRIEPWSRQADLIGAVGDWDWVFCRSGHKVGKSMSCAGLALWWVCTRPAARAILTAPSGHQIKDIIWVELRKLYPRVRAALKGGEFPLDPMTGLLFANGAQIIGVATNKPEKVAGFSSPHLMFIVDEGSGYPDELFEAIKGNSAGGAKVVSISNPTRTVGWFANGFKGGTYNLSRTSGIDPTIPRLLHISGEESPNVVANDNGSLIPGLATRAYVEKMRRDCGPDYDNDAEYLVRVRGDFPAQGTDSVIGAAILSKAHERWLDASPNSWEPLRLGVDVARFGGDESVIYPVRGLYVYEPVTIKNADGHAVAAEVVRVARMLRTNDECVQVNVDEIGVGASVVDALTHGDGVSQGVVTVYPINVATSADDDEHSNLRARLWFNLRAQLAGGLAVPESSALDSELLAHTYTIDRKSLKAVVSKDKIKALIQRSPDHADALALAVFDAGAACLPATALPRATADLTAWTSRRGAKSLLKAV